MSSENKTRKKGKLLFFIGLGFTVLSLTIIDHLHWDFVFSGIGAGLAIYGFILMQKEKKKAKR